MLKEFKEFAIKGNMLDLAIGVVLGAAFGKVIDSLVTNMLTPIVGAVSGKVDFAALGFDVMGIKINYGMFLNALINFLIVAFVLFFVVKAVNAMKRKEEAAPTPPSNEEVLLAEIRDAIRAKA
jgi:large conductance mechanosensitive channel